MNYRKFSIQSGLICVCLLLVACNQKATAIKLNASSASAPIQYERKLLPEDKNDYISLGLTNCQSGIQISAKQTIIACRNKALDTTTDYGLRLFLINLSRSKPTIDYYSHGVQDAYYMKLSGFVNSNSKKPELIMAEYGAEYSYGVNVFTLKGDKINFLGVIEEVVNIDENAASVVPYISITESAGEIRFTFIRDVLQINKQGEYIPVPKEKIKYISSQQGGFHKEEITRE
ncbi:MAG: hypothetical protein PVJ68_00505 [Candidatus Thiodiazotropha sp.]|jgi:hypothetical protein